MRLILRITEEERHLLELSLQRWRWNIADDPPRRDKLVFFDQGQRQACRYTAVRIDEMLGRLRDIDMSPTNGESHDNG